MVRDVSTDTISATAVADAIAIQSTSISPIVSVPISAKSAVCAIVQIARSAAHFTNSFIVLPSFLCIKKEPFQVLINIISGMKKAPCNCCKVLSSTFTEYFTNKFTVIFAFPDDASGGIFFVCWVPIFIKIENF